MKKNVKIFLLMGITKESGHWSEEFLDHLRENFGVDDFVMMDIPGTGALNDHKSHLTFKGVVNQMRDEYSKHIQGDEKRILVSISMGSMIGTAWTKWYADDFHQMTIINSSFRGYSPIHKRVQPYAMKKFLKVAATRESVAKETTVIKMCSNNTDKHEKMIKKWSEVNDLRPVKVRNMVRQLISGMSFIPEVPPHIPYIIICSRYDRLASFECSMRLHEKWGGDFHLIDDKNVGHAVHIDAPQLLADVIFHWSEKQNSL